MPTSRAFAVATLFAAALLAPAGEAAAAQFLCTGNVVTNAPETRAVERNVATTVLLEIEADRIVLIGPDAIAALRILRVEGDGEARTYHFGGIAGDLVFKGTFAVPDFRLIVRGADTWLTLDITMSCLREEPRLLF